MTQNSSLRHLRIAGPDELTQVIPYLVGFTPEESLVIAVINQGVVAVTARVDIGDVQPAGEAEQLLDRIWARFPGSDACMVAYTADQPAGWALLQRCAEHLPADAARRTMVVDGDTWHLPDGTSGPADRFGPIAAEASFHGLQRLPSRSELVAGFASPPDTDHLTSQARAALDRLPRTDQTSQIITRMGHLIRHNLPARATEGHPPHRVEVGDAVQLAVLAQNGLARQVAMLAIIQADAPRHLALWRGVVSTVPTHMAEGPLFLAGMAAWAAGEGAAASIVLERTTQISETGHFPPARLLDELLDQVVPPAAWETLRTTGLDQADPRVRTEVAGIQTPAVWESIGQHPLNTPRRQPPDVTPPSPGIAL